MKSIALVLAAVLTFGPATTSVAQTVPPSDPNQSQPPTSTPSPAPSNDAASPKPAKSADQADTVDPNAVGDKIAAARANAKKQAKKKEDKDDKNTESSPH